MGGGHLLTMIECPDWKNCGPHCCLCKGSKQVSEIDYDTWVCNNTCTKCFGSGRVKCTLCFLDSPEDIRIWGGLIKASTQCIECEDGTIICPRCNGEKWSYNE